MWNFIQYAWENLGCGALLKGILAILDSNLQSLNYTFRSTCGLGYCNLSTTCEGDGEK